MSQNNPPSEDEYSEGDTVEVQITAEIIETYEDGSALVDADGTELMVYEGEYRSQSDSDSEDESCDTHVWWCEYCTEQVGTQGEEPDECPTCGESDGWENIIEKVK